MRKAFLIGVIAYSACLLAMQDWPQMIANTGAQSAPFLGLMLVDALFALAALVKLVGPAFFEGEEEEVTVHADDVNVPDNWFYGLFGIDLVGHLGWHGYEAIMTTGGDSFFASIFVMVEVVAGALTFILFKYAQRVALRKARSGNVTNFRTGT